MDQAILLAAIMRLCWACKNQQREASYFLGYYLSCLVFFPAAVSAWAGIGFTFIIVSKSRRERVWQRSAASPRLSESDVRGGNGKDAKWRGLIGCLHEVVRRMGSEW